LKFIGIASRVEERFSPGESVDDDLSWVSCIKEESRKRRRRERRRREEN